MKFYYLASIQMDRFQQKGYIIPHTIENKSATLIIKQGNKLYPVERHVFS